MKKIVEKRAEEEELYSGRKGIEYLELPHRIYMALKRAGKNTLSDLSQLTEDELRSIRGMGGKNNYCIVVEKLEEFGLSLRDSKEIDTSVDASEKQDEFVESVVKVATKRKKVKMQDKQAEELEKQYKNLYNRNNPQKKGPSLDDN